MKLEEKLQNLYDLSIAQADREGRDALKQYRENLERIYREHCAAKEEETRQAVKDEEAAVQRELNRKLSEKQIEMRHTVSARQEEIREALFKRVQEKLEDRKKTPGYLNFICRKIKEAESFADGESMRLYIDPSDEKLLPEISARTGRMPAISREPFLGGVRAVIDSSHILMDDSFSTLLSEAKRDFTFEEARS